MEEEKEEREKEYCRRRSLSSSSLLWGMARKKKREENGLFLPARNLGKHFTCLLLHDFLALDVGGWVVSSSCLSSLPLKGIHCTVAHKSFGIYGVAPLPPSLPPLEAAAEDNNKQPKKRREENNFFGTG